MRPRYLLSALAAVTLVFATTACSSAAEDPAGIDTLTGAWTMTTLETGTDGTLEQTPYSGQIVFSDADTMSVQAMNPDTAAPDTAYTVNGYEAYYGPVSVDSDRQTFTITVESAAVRDLIGQTLTRNWAVSGDTLTLTPVDPAEGFRVTYQRASS